MVSDPIEGFLSSTDYLHRCACSYAHKMIEGITGAKAFRQCKELAIRWKETKTVRCM